MHDADILIPSSITTGTIPFHTIDVPFIIQFTFTHSRKSNHLTWHPPTSETLNTPKCWMTQAFFLSTKQNKMVYMKPLHTKSPLVSPQQWAPAVGDW